MVSRSAVLVLLLAFGACEGGHGIRCLDGRSFGPDGRCTFLETNDGAVPDAQQGADAGPCGACPADTPLCRDSDMMCVACLGDGDCPDRCDTEAGMPPAAATDDECGVADLDDGLCRNAGGATNRCTIPCGTSDDCRPGFACNTGATTPYCEL